MNDWLWLYNHGNETKQKKTIANKLICIHNQRAPPTTWREATELL